LAKKRSVTPNGDAIRIARLRQVWTTKRLSERARCSLKTIENAERGNAIYANTLARIASVLDVDPDSLIAKAVEEQKPVEPTKPPTEQRKYPPLESWVATKRVEAVFLMARRKDQPIDSEWFIDQLKSHVALQDPIEVYNNMYFETPLMPEGGVRIALIMTVRDFMEVYEYLTSKPIPALKVVALTSASVFHPYKPDDYLWRSPMLWLKPPHSHLYD
jgi:transcriptional regulator with XRE-family HTH domain